MRKTRAFVFLFLSFALLPLAAEDDISFSGGYTRLLSTESGKEILLTGGAQVATGSLDIEAQEIRLEGDGYSQVVCDGNVTVTEAGQGLTVRSPQISYDRNEDVVSVHSWVEIDDTQNSIVASAGNLVYTKADGMMTLESHVRLLQADDSGRILSCSCERMTFDRSAKILSLTGDARVTWGSDSYEAHAITVHLDTEEIVMAGSIKGTVHG